jgi:hypothetical protein
LKTCRKCGRTLPLECFSPNKSHKDGLSHHCKECRSEYFKEQYLCGKRTVDTYKTHCAKCGCARPYVLTFHHIDYRTKSFEISGARRSIKSIVKEIEKCICLCHNCHHTFHYFYGMQPYDPIGALDEFLSDEWTPPIAN